MASIPKELKANKGDSILPKWKKLLEFIGQTGIVPGPGVRITRTTNGTHIYADHFQKPWSHPWKVSATPEEVTVRAGTVNGLVPWIGEEGKRVRINGLDDENKEIEVPPLPIRFRTGSFVTEIVLVVKLQEEEGIAISDTPESLYIDHRYEGDPSTRAGGATDVLGTGIYPLAKIYWSRDTEDIRAVHQICHHNLQHRFQQSSPKSGRPARHFFWAA